MKIWITKDTPTEFVRRGIDSLKAWASPPHFNPGRHEDVFCNHALVYPRWEADFLFSGQMLRKLGGPVADDVWEALKYSYAFDQSQDLYAPVRDYYEAAYTYHRYHRPGASNRAELPFGQITEKLNWYQDIKADRYASTAVEKEGQRWWEWVMTYDITVALLHENP